MSIENQDSTEVQDIDVPDEYGSYAEAYYDLLGHVDEGLMIVVEEQSDLEQYEGGSHDNVPAFVTDEGLFMWSSNGEFTNSLNIPEADDLEGDFVSRDGDTMSGSLDMDGNSITNVSNLTGEFVDDLRDEFEVTFVNRDGDRMTGDLNMGGNDVLGVWEISGTSNFLGGTFPVQIASDINMNENNITSVQNLLVVRIDADGVEADTVEADTVEADTVEADTVEADTVEADTVEAKESLILPDSFS